MIRRAGPAAAYAFDEFFAGRIRNRYTRAAYLHAVRRFMAWIEGRCGSIEQITPGLIGAYFDEHSGAAPTRKLHLSAIRAFFDVLVNRHVVVLNPAASVRGERHQVIEGKTPEITRDQARQLLAWIPTDTPVGRRDAAVVATLIYTAARAGAVAGLRMKHLQWDGKQYTLRFLEKGGKSRLIPVQHKLHGYLLEYLDSLDWKSQPANSPLFRSAAGRTGLLTDRPMRNIDVCRMVKRRLRAAGLPDQFSPHSFRVATLTDLLIQGVSLEDAAYLAGHADPRTTRLYDRRKQEVTRGTVEKISI
ncbi:MAG TPA: tyrosine-type recombinase/integrase [Pirellulales bacterium]|nr:tyrosine-type recombinase/integrase [Pirellulales bacterium]